MYRAGANEYSYQSHTGTGTVRGASVDADAMFRTAQVSRREWTKNQFVNGLSTLTGGAARHALGRLPPRRVVNNPKMGGPPDEHINSTNRQPILDGRIMPGGIYGIHCTLPKEPTSRLSRL